MPGKPTYEALEHRVRELEDLETRLRHTDELLRDELSWRRLLIDESRDPIAVLDQHGAVFDANTRFAEMLGYTPDELSRLHVWDWDAVLTPDQLMGLVMSVDATGHHFETRHRRKDGVVIDVELSNNGAMYRGQKLVFCICRDISERKRAEQEREELIRNLRESLAEIRTLRGILPLCSYCKKVRDDDGYWEQVDTYIRKHSEASVSHGICPDCMKAHFPKEFERLYPDDRS
jgi:PAS domain S-box-containing protein